MKITAISNSNRYLQQTSIPITGDGSAIFSVYMKDSGSGVATVELIGNVNNSGMRFIVNLSSGSISTNPIGVQPGTGSYNINSVGDG